MKGGAELFMVKQIQEQTQKLNEIALGYSIAIISGLGMILFWIFGKIGFYRDATDMMMQMHMFFNMNITGMITGAIEAAVWGFIAGWLIAYFYNKFA